MGHVGEELALGAVGGFGSRPGPYRCFEQAIGPEAQTTGEDEHDHRQQRLLHLYVLTLSCARVVAGMRLYVAERHSRILLQSRGLRWQEAAQLILGGTHLLATKVERIASPGRGNEV